jgi:hypothetical protein
MRLPFLKKKDTTAMSEGELEKGIARWDKVLDIRPKLGDFFAVTTIFVTAAAQLTLVMMAGTITGGAAFFGLAIGVGYFLGGCYTCKGVLGHALKQRNAMTDIFNTKVTVRLAAEQENARLLRIKAAEDFNAAIEAGLPLERDIKVGHALKLKRPAPPEHHGIERIKDLLDPRF